MSGVSNRSSCAPNSHQVALCRVLSRRPLRRDGGNAQGELVTEPACPFCEIASERLIYSSANVFGVWDAYPVSPGHALIITRRHFGQFFEATTVEHAALLEGAMAVKAIIERDYTPDGFNLGINVGEAAGQTIQHL